MSYFSLEHNMTHTQYGIWENMLNVNKIEREKKSWDFVEDGDDDGEDK